MIVGCVLVSSMKSIRRSRRLAKAARVAGRGFRACPGNISVIDKAKRAPAVFYEAGRNWSLSAARRT